MKHYRVILFVISHVCWSSCESVFSLQFFDILAYITKREIRGIVIIRSNYNEIYSNFLRIESKINIRFIIYIDLYIISLKNY